ncbi:hypothetical protein DL98DRAFT_615827 [Cadophora sp. DSE1049]|nr:hypothetical protein DL98DRAFT_615827 [Cadophora sp. DSE1049]
MAKTWGNMLGINPKQEDRPASPDTPPLRQTRAPTPAGRHPAKPSRDPSPIARPNAKQADRKQKGKIPHAQVDEIYDPNKIKQCRICKANIKMYHMPGNTRPRCKKRKQDNVIAQAAAFAEIREALGHLSDAVKKFEKARNHQ